MPYYSDYLAHYGVKGMKWGVRKNRYKGVRTRLKKEAKADKDKWRSMSRSERRKYRDTPNARYSKQNREINTNVFGEKASKRINRRMNKGATYKNAYFRETGRQIAKATILGSLGSAATTAAVGVAVSPELRQLAINAINTAAKQPFIKFANSQAAKNAAKRAAEQTFKIGDEVVKLKPWQYKVA